MVAHRCDRGSIAAHRPGPVPEARRQRRRGDGPLLPGGVDEHILRDHQRREGVGLVLTGFIKRGSRVLYRWSDVLEWLDLNTIQRTDDPRQ